MNIKFSTSIYYKMKEVGFLLLAVLLPFLFTISWLYKNDQLPTSDATDYLAAAFKNYQNITTQGFWNNFFHFKLILGWRPISFSVIILPFLLIAHGNVFLAVKIVTLFLLLLSGLYIYLFFRLKLSHFAAIVATNLICLLPFVQTQALTFFAESALLPSLLGSIYHLIQSDYLQNKKHSFFFIIFVTLAITLRPIEAITQLAGIFLLFLYLGWRKHIFSVKQIVGLLALSLSAIFIFLFFCATHLIHRLPFSLLHDNPLNFEIGDALYKLLITSMVGVILCWGSFTLLHAHYIETRWSYFINPHSKSASPLFIYFVILSLCMLWFIPHAFQTFVWIYRTSLGDLAQITALTQVEVGLWKKMYTFVQDEGALIVTGILILALIALVTEGKKLKRIFTLPVCYLFLCLPFPVWEVLNTVQSTPRKLAIAFPFFLIALLTISLQEGRNYAVRLLITLALVLIQFIYVVNFISTPTLMNKNIFGHYPAPITFQPNPHEVVSDFLQVQAQRYKLKKISLETDVASEKPVDIFLLLLMSLIKNHSYAVSYPEFSIYHPNNLQKLHNETDAVFLTDKIENFILNEPQLIENKYRKKFLSERNPTAKTKYQFLLLFVQNKLSDNGWAKGPCLTIKSVDNQNYFGCLFLTNKNK